ncbi:MAG: isocitrate/isopropylmalate family dehydrogenase, partial [Actinomyces sp.]|nr:isocitrate/isopropylmalate family dehydrogenase [Actinomyces sp.]
MAIELAVIPGDGIGQEVVPEGLKVLDAVLAGSGVGVQRNLFDLGAARWHRTGEVLTDEDLEAIKTNDAILLGAVGDPS